MCGFAMAAFVACNDNADTTGTNEDTAKAVEENNAGSLSTSSSNAGYVDLSSGEKVDLWYDQSQGRTINRVTNEPVDFYINSRTGDTIYGSGRYVVNNMIIRSDDGKWKLDDTKIKRDGNEWKMKTGDTKIKVDEDGDMKIENGDKKTKIDKDGDVKEKDN